MKAGWALLRPDSPLVADQAKDKLSAYVHVPFCARLCPYCDFAVVTGRDGQVDRYVRAVVSEMAMEPSAGPLDAVFVGGGTPSRLPPELVRLLISSLAARFGLTPGAEVSIEANPEDWTPQQSDGLREAGITRVSFGAQSFDPAVLAGLGRVHGPDEIARAVRQARASGFDSISLDLIFGDPAETPASWRNTVAHAIELSPDHLSTYALTVERGTALSRSIAAGAPAPDEDRQADAYEEARELLGRAGFVQYEVSNHARPGHACRYNLTTWAQGDYLAFGLGAHGHRGGTRRRNVRRFEAYLAMVESGDRPEAGREVVAGWAAEQERVMLGLRRSAGVLSGPAGAALLASRDGGELVRAGVLALRDGRLVVARPLLTDAVIRAVLALPEPAG